MLREGYGPFKQTETNCRSPEVGSWWSKQRTWPLKERYFGWAIEVWYHTALAFSFDYRSERRLWSSEAARGPLSVLNSLLVVNTVDMADRRALLLWSVDRVQSQEWYCLLRLLICYTAILQHTRLRSATSMFLDVLTLGYIIYSMEMRFICLIYHLSLQAFWYRPQRYEPLSIYQNARGLRLYRV